MNNSSDLNNFSDLVSSFIGIIALLIPLIFAITLLFIVWKVIDAWVIHGGDEGKVEDGKHVVIVGVIALVIMSGIWGILSILQNSFFEPF
jgi:hypothetical protein